MGRIADEHGDRIRPLMAVDGGESHLTQHDRPIDHSRTISIPMVRWIIQRGGCPLDLGIRNPVQTDPSRALDLISVPDFELDDSLIYPDQMTKESPARNSLRKREPTPKPSEFAISLAAYIRQQPGRVQCVATVKKRKSIPIQRTRLSSLFDHQL
jgi:hypothetical protein